MNVKRRTFFQTVAAATAWPWLQDIVEADDTKDSKTANPSHRILSCNVRIPQPQDAVAGDGWPERRELCGDVICAQQADVICLQECQIEQLDYLKGRLPDFASHGLANPSDVFHPQNSILYSTTRYAMLSAGGFWLSETPHVAGSSSWDSARPRFANWVQLQDRTTGREFRVWNTHLDHKGQVAREQQARLLNEACRPFPDLPQVLVGDFNADIRNAAVTAVIEDGWIDTYVLIRGPKDPGFTYHAFIGPKRAERITEKNPGKIDWIFVRNVERIVDAKIIYDARNGRYPSDHYFVSADVVFSGKEA